MNWQNNDDDLHFMPEWADKVSRVVIVFVAAWFLVGFVGCQVIPHFVGGGR